MSKVQGQKRKQAHALSERRNGKNVGRWTLDFGLLLLFLLIGFVSQVQAQPNTCTLKLAELPDSPALFGFRAGMTMEQAKLRVPQIIFGRTNEFGVAQTSISPDFDPRFDKASFAGIRTVSLDFLDNRVTSIWLGHDSTYKWQTVPDYVQGVSGALRLPNAWTPWKTRGQRLDCADFEITLIMLGEGPSFRIIDTGAAKIIAARRQAKEELDAAAEEGAETEIIGDKQTKVYYAEGCQPTKAIKDSNRVVFGTVEEAEKAGFKLAKDCQ